MHSSDTHIRKVVVNGQEMLVPDEAAWSILLSNPMIDEQHISVTDLLWNDYQLIQPFPELRIGFRKAGFASLTWLYCVLLCIEGELQRVHLEYVTCNVCGWQGTVANPQVPDIYIDVPDWHTALVASDKYTQVSCPRCKSSLPRYYIWVEPLPETAL